LRTRRRGCSSRRRAKSPHGLLFRGQTLWIVEVARPFTRAAAETVSTAAADWLPWGRRPSAVVTERQTSALSRVVRSNRPPGGQGKPAEAGRARCRRSVQRRARFCRSSAANQPMLGCSSLKTWFADVGRTHLVCPGPPQGDAPASELVLRKPWALSTERRGYARNERVRGRPLLRRTGEARGVGLRDHPRFTVRRQALRVVRGPAPNPGRNT
jgi:hypothetical protein